VGNRNQGGHQKLTLAEPFDDFMDRAIADNGLTLLPIRLPHATALTSLPHHHRDPFDRLLVAQAIEEQVSIVSKDSALDAYGIDRIW
jgi:PIN domain nuclease of toxin-antitoxin system